MKRVAVCGGRDYHDAEHIYRVLDAYHEQHGIKCIIEGGANGADHYAFEWATANGVAGYVVNAQWTKYGKAAGPIRNQLIIDEFKPDILIAFPGGIGTADMSRRAREAGIEVHDHAREEQV